MPSLSLDSEKIYVSVRKCNHDSLALIVGNFDLITSNFCEILSDFLGGEEAKEGEFPHMALIGFGEGNPEGKISFPKVVNFSS